MHRLRLVLVLVVFAFVAMVARAATAPTILVFGDSLSAAYGMELRQSWPALLQERLRALGYRHRVVNASIGGETTAGGRARFASELKRQQPTIVILELGGNDGLRGLPVAEIETNLKFMIAAARQARARVVLAGMRLPPNYGAYGTQFEQVYKKLAQTKDVVLVPFFLEGVGGQTELMQADGIHPRAEAQEKILANVWPGLSQLLTR